MMKHMKQILLSFLLLLSMTCAANMPAPHMFTISPEVIIVPDDNEEYIIGYYDLNQVVSDFSFSQPTDYKTKDTTFSVLDSTGKISSPSCCYMDGDILVIDLSKAVGKDSSTIPDCSWYWGQYGWHKTEREAEEENLGEITIAHEDGEPQDEDFQKQGKNLRSKIIEQFKACDTSLLIRAKGESRVKYKGKNTCANVIIYKPSTDWYYISPTILNDYKQESVPHFPNSLQWITILLSMIITVIVEVGVGWLFFYRSKKDLAIIAATNAITNILMNITLCSTIFANTSYAKGLGFAALLIVVEPIIWIVESIVYSCALEKKAKHYILKAWGFALAANVASLLIGLLFGQCVRELALLIMHP
ncbi:MAG: hypothetical protein J6Y22_03675 [Paludibacteraceae bacterium]|nr:hypothetical protein [Paludibacteraceae bacterium]